MKKRRLLSLLLAALMCMALLAACNNNGNETSPTPEGGDNTPTTSPTGGDAVKQYTTPLVVAYSKFSNKFSPFFAETAYDMDAMEMTQIALLYTDRAGAIVYNGGTGDGEVISYNGVDYTYKTPNNIKEEYDAAKDQTTYTWTLREGLQFSDGTPVTADDVIFSFYVYFDPDYTGFTTLNALDIPGLQNYRTQTTDAIFEKYNTLFDEVFAAGAGYTLTGEESFTQEMYDFVWNRYGDSWFAELGQGISNFVKDNYESYVLADFGIDSATYTGSEGWIIAGGMYLWGFADFADGILTSKSGVAFDTGAGEFPTAADYGKELSVEYGNDAYACWATEDAGDISADIEADARKNFISELGAKDPEMGGAGIPNVEGLKKIDDLTVQLTVNGFDAAAIWRTGIPVAPLHYYGSASQYDYDNNKFGFPFNDLSMIRSKTTQPMGAGPYKFDKYENGVVYFEANEYYWRGEPKIKYMQFKETDDADKIPGVGTGTLDIAEPNLSKDSVKDIQSYNSNGDLTGDVMTSILTDFRGYGYIGLNANTMNVGGKIDSAESKNLRKGLATLLAAYRELTVDSYYGERASVINYPISNTSWAAPQKTDQGYRVAYSVDVDGKDIYNSSMTADEKYAAALEACIGFLKAAGYTWDDASGKFTEAPAGAKMSYELIIPGEGGGNHPTFVLADEAKKAFESIGIELVINDPSDSNVMWDKLNALTQEMWCAAWGATTDPDIYQIYHSSQAVPFASNRYYLIDSTLDKLIIDARATNDQSFRKSTYKAAFDLILDWGVEIPNYQRKECTLFSTERINVSTLPDITTHYAWGRDIELLELND